MKNSAIKTLLLVSLNLIFGSISSATYPSTSYEQSTDESVEQMNSAPSLGYYSDGSGGYIYEHPGTTATEDFDYTGNQVGTYEVVRLKDGVPGGPLQAGYQVDVNGKLGTLATSGLYSGYLYLDTGEDSEAANLGTLGELFEIEMTVPIDDGESILLLLILVYVSTQYFKRKKLTN